MTRRQPTTLVVGLGNRDRGDDTVGLVVADALAGRGLAADVRTHEGTDLDLLDLWEGRDRVVLIDAVRSHGLPGTIDAMDAEDLTAGIGGGSHDFGLAAVVELARRLGRLPARVEIRTIAIADGTVHGTPMTRAVANAADRLVEALVEELGATARRGDWSGSQGAARPADHGTI